MRFEIARCRALYADADIGIAMLPPRSASCVAAAPSSTAASSTASRRQGYDVFSRRARVPTPVKLAVAARHLADRMSR